MPEVAENLTLARLLSSQAYNTIDDLPWILESVFKGRRPIRTNKKVLYYNVPCAFDIETSSFYEISDKSEKPVKQACMYEWTLGINGYVIIGRTWEEFKKAVDVITFTLGLNESKRLVIYVHNLAYEFQWIRKRFEWVTVFGLRERKPAYAATKSGIEFRCSLVLSGYSLENLGNNELKTYKVQKMVGDLDYNLIRHPNTPLTDKEIGYCINDVKVVMAYIQERIEADGDITRIPLTKTGYVRRYCREQCLGTGKPKNWTRAQWNYKDKMRRLGITPDEYTQLKCAFQGGFTHANPFYSGQTLHDVDSYDFTSSYPAVIVSEQFPMSSSRLVEPKTKEEFAEYLQEYCCLFDVRFTNLRPKILSDNILSWSHCWDHEGNYQLNNGRVVWADTVATTCTETDFMCMTWFYEWDKAEIQCFRIYDKSYLPKAFVQSVLKLYKDKTELKGIEGRESEYGLKKGMLNSCYGMMVTDICRDEISYIDEWTSHTPELNSQIAKYNTSYNRFLFYPWGIWVTSYARRNLYTGIRAVGKDYIYADTDSIKMLNGEQHKDYIEEYNEYITDKLKTAMEFHGIPYEEAAPLSVDGVSHPLGVWDYEGHYSDFKTLGAKRYMLKENGKYKLTVAGLSKQVAMKYISDKSENPFEFFTDNMYIPAGKTGKLTHTYIDEEISGIVTDYLGEPYQYHELSAVHMEGAEYSLSLATQYVNYLTKVQEGRNGI